MLDPADVTSNIAGLVMLPDYLPEPTLLLAELDELPWLDDLSRRVQHYGWRYDYKARNVPKNAYLGALPNSLALIAERLFEERLMGTIADQAIVNEYEPGQGIAAHIDCEPCFGPEIATLSLGDTYPMTFTNVATGTRIDVWLPVGSVCVMAGDARYRWRHEIAKRKTDPSPDGRRQRRRRVSVTFRTVVGS